MKRKYLWHRWLQWPALDAEAPQGNIAGCRNAAYRLLRAVYLRLGWRPLRATEEKGVLLLEALVAVGLLTTVISAMVVGLSTGSIGVRTADERVTVQSIARSQLEYTMDEASDLAVYCTAPCSYTSIGGLPPGYTVTSEALDYNGDPNVQKIVVTVYRDGQAVGSMEGIKAKW